MPLRVKLQMKSMNNQQMKIFHYKHLLTYKEFHNKQATPIFQSNNRKSKTAIKLPRTNNISTEEKGCKKPK